ncbi:MAG: prephenate dehydrogenase/arogenate dehydrogenase family protein [Vulcanimicrobiaceae bacterium]
MTSSRTLGIAGVGMIGASIGLRAAATGYVVHGWDPSPDHLARARSLGAIAATATDPAALGRVVDTLVIAAPLDGTLALLEAFARQPPGASLVLDVASVKACVARAGSAIAGFVATHPIAGSERSGPDAASADIFADRVWTYDAGAPGPSAERARAFIADMGARAVAIGSDEHDRVVALTSHLPQVLAVALGAHLAARQDEAHVVDLCGTGMASMLRLGASSWEVWRAVLAANDTSVAKELRAVANVLFSVAAELDADRVEPLAALFASSAAAVARLNQNDALLGRVEHQNRSDER